MTNEELIATIRNEIERLYDGEAPRHNQQCDFDDGYFTGIGAISKFLDTFEEPVSDDLEEAAEKKYPVYWKDYPKDGIARSELSYDTNKQCRDAFIAGAKWDREQNKPKPTEDLVDYAYRRYPICNRRIETTKDVNEDLRDGFLEGVDWQKEQMMKDAVETELYWDGDFLAIDLNMAALGYSEHDKVRVIVCKKED